MVVVSQSAVPSFTPCVEASVFSDTGTVGGATGCVNDKLSFHCFYQMGCVHISILMKKGKKKGKLHFLRYKAYLIKDENVQTSAR